MKTDNNGKLFLTPTWEQAFNVYVHILKYGTKEGVKEAKAGLLHMSRVADLASQFSNGKAAATLLKGMNKFRQEASPQLFAKIFSDQYLHLYEKFTRHYDVAKFFGELDTQNSNALTVYIQSQTLNF